ncbi:MAG: transposase [Pseudomonadota bacterium]
MDHHRADGGGTDTRQNGYGRKTMLNGDGKTGLDVPRDRQPSSQLLAKHQWRFPDFNAKLISIYARGISVREVVGRLWELYGLDVSPDFVGAVTAIFPDTTVHTRVVHLRATASAWSATRAVNRSMQRSR